MKIDTLKTISPQRQVEMDLGIIDGIDLGENIIDPELPLIIHY